MGREALTAAPILRIATRESRLALWQSQHVADALKAHHPGLQVELVPMTTIGDRIIDQPLARIGGKGLFIKELEIAMVEGRADLAVHSMKDVPAELPADFTIGAILARADPRDALVSSTGVSLAALPQGARVGTSSLRRRSQLLARRPDLDIVDLRGNVPTRLGRLDAGDFDAIVLAAAGLQRLQLLDSRCSLLPTSDVLPAVAQGAIGLEARIEDDWVLDLIKPLNCVDSALRVTAERAMNQVLGGSCHVPIAGFAELHDKTLFLRGLIATVDGSEVLRQTASGSVADALEIGRTVGHGLIESGADRILKAILSDGE